MVLKPRIENKTILVMALFVGILSFMLGLGKFGIVYFQLGSAQFLGAFLLLGGTILLTETFSRGDIFSSKKSLEKWLMLVLIVFAYGLGLWQIMGKVLTGTMDGVAGVVYLALGISVVYQLFH